MDEARFKNAFIITSTALGEGHFRHMAVIEKRFVNILQAPGSGVDELMKSHSTEGPNTKPAEIVTRTAPLSGKDKISAGLTALAEKKDTQ